MSWRQDIAGITNDFGCLNVLVPILMKLNFQGRSSQEFLKISPCKVPQVGYLKTLVTIENLVDFFKILAKLQKFAFKTYRIFKSANVALK